MKRKLSLWLVCLLALLMPLQGFAAREYTLPEKMRQQLQLSSLNGSAKLLVDGDGDWVKALHPFSDQLLNFYYTETEESMGVELYAKPDENSKAGRTLLYSDGAEVYLQSDLLIDTVLKLPLRGDWISTLFHAGESENPSFYSILLSALRGEGDWAEATSGLRSALEFWLDGYASTPETTVVDGETRMGIRYSLPAEDVRAEMKALLPQLFADAALTEQLRSLMSEEQANVYLNPNLQWYYERLIDRLELDAPVSMRRSFNTLGATRETELTLPLRGFGDWSELTLTSDDAGNRYVLRSELERLELLISENNSSENNGHLSGTLVWERPERQPWHIAFDLVSLRTVTVDEEKVNHEITTYTLKLEPTADAAAHNAPVFEPALIRVRLHYHSKGLVSSSTTLDITWDATLPGGHTNGAMKLRTVAPVEIEKISPDGAVDLAALPAEKRQEYLNDWLTNARLLLAQFAQTDIEAPAEAEPAAEEIPSLLIPVDEEVAEGSEASDIVEVPVEELPDAEITEPEGESEAADDSATATGEQASETSPVLIEEEVMLDDDAEGV